MAARDPRTRRTVSKVYRELRSNVCASGVGFCRTHRHAVAKMPRYGPAGGKLDEKCEIDDRLCHFAFFSISHANLSPDMHARFNVVLPIGILDAASMIPTIVQSFMLPALQLWVIAFF
jgi:hypothetical protein